MSLMSGKKMLAIGRGMEPEAKTLFARMSVQPNQKRKRLVSDTIRTLKQGGVWPKLRFLYLFAAHSQQAALLNWCSTSFNAFLAGTSPTLSFSVNDAIRVFGSSSSTSAFIDTACPPIGGISSAASTHATVLMKTISAYNFSEFDMRSDSNFSPLAIRLSSNPTFSQLHSNPFTGVSSSLVADEVYTISKVGNVGKVVVDGTVRTTTNAPSEDGNAGNVQLLVCYQNHYSGWCRAASFGAGLTDAEAAVLNTALSSYIAGL